MKHKINWVDGGREPQCQPNPSFPHGIDLDLTGGHEPFCEIELPYPARRCGTYLIDCTTCAIRVGCTTAGRQDDPRSIRIPCLMRGQA